MTSRTRLRSADEFVQQQTVLASAIEKQTLTLWRRVQPASIASSWSAIANTVVRLITAGQLTSAKRAAPYVEAVLAEQNLRLPIDGTVDPEAFVGFAADGRPLRSLLDWPVTGRGGALDRIGQGQDPAVAVHEAGRRIGVMASTQVQDAGRGAVGIEIAARPRLGYVRVITPPSCSRCVILAGKWFRWNEGFERHPNCLPAGAVVSGPSIRAATRRSYEGELVVLLTASGKKLAITGNHPVLTDRGWVPANLLQEGDHVVSSTRPQGAGALLVPDEDQVPAVVEDLWSSGPVRLSRGVPSSPEDFHGDGGRDSGVEYALHANVDVVLPDRHLRLRRDSSLDQQVQQVLLSGGIGATEALLRVGLVPELVFGLPNASNRSMSGSRLGGPGFGAHPGCPHQASLGLSPRGYTNGLQDGSDPVSRDLEALGQGVLALPAPVGGGDVIRGQVRGGVPGARWDAPAGPLTEQNRSAYSGRGLDLFSRLTGQVELDRLVEVRRISWSGHVYNLTSSEGWFSADGLIVSNCDCEHVPATEADSPLYDTDPRAYIDSLTDTEQDRLLTKAAARAYRDGADLNQLVNARRGMTRAGLTTQEGTTRRGVAGRQLAGRQRLTPDAIDELASDRDEALRLLRRNGYMR